MSLHFIPPAWAQSAPAGGGGGDLFAQLMPLILIFVVFWFLLIRPQMKRAREHNAMVALLKRGDKVLTGGGLQGKVVRAEAGDYVEVQIADGVVVRVARNTIAVNLSQAEQAGSKRTGAPNGARDGGKRAGLIGRRSDDKS